MSPTAPLLVLVCLFAQACQPEAERLAAQLEAATSAPPLGPVSVSAWVAGLSESGASRAISAPSVGPAARAPEPAPADTAGGPAGAPEPGVPAEQAEPAEPAEMADSVDPVGQVDPSVTQDAPPPEAPAEALAEAAAPEPRRPTRTLDELLREVARTPTRDELEQARRLNKNGLGKHRRGELEAAKADYEAALAVAPAHVFSRYNLACALALTDRPAEALLHLSVLAHQAEQDRPARERLEAARIDKDFDGLRNDPRFRELTLATPIQVTWPADGADADADREAAQAIHKGLREVRWDSQLARAPWRGDFTSASLLVRAGADPVDLRAARAIHEELEVNHPGRFGLELDAALPSSGPPLVLIVSVASEPQAPTEPEPAEPLAPDDSRPLGEQLEALIGKRLSSVGQGVAEHLELRPTGFFSWERREGKERILRQGRWQLTPDGLALEYSARITEGDPPTLVVKDGLSSTHRIRVSGKTLFFEGRAFR